MSKKEAEINENKEINPQVEEVSAAQELLENPEALAEQFNRTEEYVSKNRTILLAILTVLVCGVVGGILYSNNQKDNEVKAQQAIFGAQYYFNQDSLNLALNGNASSKGFLKIAKDFSGTKAGNLANYYTGVIYLQKGEFENAIKFLSKFSSDDELVGPRAYSLIGDANMELEKYPEAVKAYTKASTSKINKGYTPRYLLKLAIAQESASDVKGATATYDKIIKEYKNSKEATTAKKYKGLVSSLAKK